MRGDTRIAVLLRKRCRWNVPGSAPQNSCVISLEDHNREIQTGDNESAYHIAVVQPPVKRARIPWSCAGL